MERLFLSPIPEYLRWRILRPHLHLPEMHSHILHYCPGTGEHRYIVQILLRKTLPTDIHLQKYGRSFFLGTF